MTPEAPGAQVKRLSNKGSGFPPACAGEKIDLGLEDQRGKPQGLSYP